MIKDGADVAADRGGGVLLRGEDDVADAVTAVPLDPPSHTGATYALTGPEALPLEAVATSKNRSKRPTPSLVA